MATQAKDFKTDYRTISIKTSDGATVQGQVNISPNQRVSDLFKLDKGPFVVLINAGYGDVTGKTLFINKDHIVWVEPEEG
ncbi:MAG: hypothetical protein M0036_09150 [Desulfobacteraceae bacterium]|nr:hypothetical protein [Desulfobacteraceae bacterium]